MAAKRTPAPRRTRAPEPAPTEKEQEPAPEYFPEGHSFVKDEALENIIASQREAAAGARATEERWAAAFNAKIAETEKMFAGLQVATRALGDEIARLTTRNIAQDQKVLEYQGIIHAKNEEISNMTRQSEEARLKREELAAQQAMRDAELRQKAMDLQSEKEKWQMTLQLVQPLAMAGGKGLMDWIQDKMRGGGAAVPGAPPGVTEQGGGLPSASSSPGGAPAAPRYRVSMNHIQEWRQFVVLALQKMKPETAALIRALAAASFSSEGPKMTMDTVIQALRADLGDDVMLSFMRLTGEAWTEEAPAAQPN